MSEMGDSNIPIIEPTIDYTKVPPIHQKRTISFINHFVVNTVSFLNKLAITCEEKLFEFENKLQRIEAAVVILESRLASIPGIEETSTIANASPPTNAEEVPKEVEAAPVQQSTEDVDETDKEVAESQPTGTQENMQPISEHPLYAKYFKLLKVGVRKEEIIRKMTDDGADPDLLEDPKRLVPRAESDELNAAS